MPRRPHISHPALRTIAEDQRFTPALAAQRTVERIEALAQEIEAGASYPRDYIVFRVTGYRPVESTLDLVPGEALLEDLSALAETIASRSVLREAPEGSLTLDGLRERWGVSRSTLERDRKRGLIARRVRTHEGIERLLFTPSVVEAFERAHPARSAERARSPARLTDEERNLILRRAPRYEEALEMSRHAIAGRLASRLGRSVNAVRAVIEAADESEARATIDERVSRVLLGQWERGIPVGRLASWVGRSRTSVHRVLLRARVERVRSAGGPGPADHANAEGGALDHALVQSGLLVPVPEDVPGVLALSLLMGRVPETEERAVALAARSAWRRGATLARTLTDDPPPAHLVDRAETDLRWAGMLRERLVWIVLPMVVRTIEERAEMGLMDLEGGFVLRLVEGAMSLVARATLDFDPSRGGRLAGRTSLPVDRLIERAIHERRDAMERNVASRRTSVVPGEWRRETRHVGGRLEAPGWLLGGMRHLDDDERGLLSERYGLAGVRPRTILELSAIRGQGARAVWSSLHRAVHRARTDRA